MNRDEFLYSRSRYSGAVKPEDLIFNANLQEFAQRVSYISNLETAGKIQPQEAYQKVEQLFEQLERSRVNLGISS
jgi:hypothetical protein